MDTRIPAIRVEEDVYRLGLLTSTTCLKGIVLYEVEVRASCLASMLRTYWIGDRQRAQPILARQPKAHGNIHPPANGQRHAVRHHPYPVRVREVPHGAIHLLPDSWQHG